jgi:hypothetical protein
MRIYVRAPGVREHMVQSMRAGAGSGQGRSWVRMRGQRCAPGVSGTCKEMRGRYFELHFGPLPVNLVQRLEVWHCRGAPTISVCRKRLSVTDIRHQTFQHLKRSAPHTFQVLGAVKNTFSMLMPTHMRAHTHTFTHTHTHTHTHARTHTHTHHLPPLQRRLLGT